MTKLELVGEIEERLGIATSKLHHADKFTLETILKALEPKPRRVPIVVVNEWGRVWVDVSARVMYDNGPDKPVEVVDLDGEQTEITTHRDAMRLGRRFEEWTGTKLADHPDDGKRFA